MSGFVQAQGGLMADGVALSQLATEIGTPAYVYSAAVIESQYEKLRGAMKKALPADRQPLLCFACKANSNVAVLSLLRSLGSGLEIVSEGELVRGLRAGFDATKIVSTGVGKQDGEIAACLKAGIMQFNVESLPELAAINRIAGETGLRAKVAFRLNPDVSGGGHHKISTGRRRDKFGMGMETMREAYALASSMEHVDPVGLSMHIGSQVFEVGKFKEAFAKLPAIVADLRGAGHSVTRLDIGGGFPIVYRDEKLLDLDEYARWVNDIIVPLGTEIVMEPGRYLVGNAGVLLSKVIYVKETQDRNFLIIDAAMNDLIRPAMYDAWHGIDAVAPAGSGEREVYDVVGPVCETGDTFTESRELPKMNAGDLVVIRSAGAYGASMASNYNTRPLAPEILVSDGRYAVIRERQDYERIVAADIIPDWLARR